MGRDHAATRWLASPIACALLSCTSGAPCGPPVTTAYLQQRIVVPDRGLLDLLFVLDNGPDSRDNAANVNAQLVPMIDALVSPPCTTATNQTPHTCDPSDPADFPIHESVDDLHVAVVSTDLGTPGHATPTCVAPNGDDGLLNPIRNGAAEQQHEPWATAPPTYGRPANCSDPNQYPSFIAFHSDAAWQTPTDPRAFETDFRCNADLYTAGCAFGQPLEAAYRALVVRDASDRAGNTSPNAGFLRSDALLGIVVISPHDDRSVRDCSHAPPGTSCIDATGVYDPASTSWASSDLGLRFYLDQPGSANDPTWPLERYVDPRDATAGFYGLKPGQPSRLFFAALVGVPVPSDGPNSGWATVDGSIDWNLLLGAPGGAGPEDFDNRDTSSSIDTMSAEGRVSMRQANLDPNCPRRTVPACRRRGSAFVPTNCSTDQQYFAWPARRLVEIARRFDQAPLCAGAPCRRGIVYSLCDTDYSLAMGEIVAGINSGYDRSTCLARAPRSQIDADGNVTVACVLRETEPGDPNAPCDASRGRSDPMAGTPTFATIDGTTRRVCTVHQAPTDPVTRQPVGPTLGFYDARIGSAWADSLAFVRGAAPRPGSILDLECVDASPAPPSGGSCDGG